MNHFYLHPVWKGITTPALYLQVSHTPCYHIVSNPSVPVTKPLFATTSPCRDGTFSRYIRCKYLSTAVDTPLQMM